MNNASPEEIIGNRAWTQFQSCLLTVQAQGKKPAACIIGYVDYADLIRYVRSNCELRQKAGWSETNRLCGVRIFSNTHDEFGFVFGESLS